jgi:hypothetical protein
VSVVGPTRAQTNVPPPTERERETPSLMSSSPRLGAIAGKNHRSHARARLRSPPLAPPAWLRFGRPCQIFSRRDRRRRQRRRRRRDAITVVDSPTPSFTGGRSGVSAFVVRGSSFDRSPPGNEGSPSWGYSGESPAGRDALEPPRRTGLSRQPSGCLSATGGP